MSDGRSPGDDVRMKIFKRLLDSEGYIIPAQWMHARRDSEPVGQCVCGGDMQPAMPVNVNDRRTDYAAWCVDCGREMIAPFGKTLKPKPEH